jgi:hypothetical protein
MRVVCLHHILAESLEQSNMIRDNLMVLLSHKTRLGNLVFITLLKGQNMLLLIRVESETISNFSGCATQTLPIDSKTGKLIEANLGTFSHEIQITEREGGTVEERILLSFQEIELFWRFLILESKSSQNELIADFQTVQND